MPGKDDRVIVVGAGPVGLILTLKLIRSGVPVTVYYTQEGDRMLASKVVVRQAPIPSDSSTVIKKSTTTTTTTTPAP